MLIPDHVAILDFPASEYPVVLRFSFPKEIAPEAEVIEPAARVRSEATVTVLPVFMENVLFAAPDDTENGNVPADKSLI